MYLEPSINIFHSISCHANESKKCIIVSNKENENNTLY